MLRQQPDDAFELSLHRRGHLGPRLAKILEIRRREDEHLAGAVRPIEVVAVSRACHLHPRGKVLHFLLRALREQIVCDPQRQQARAVQLVHHVVVGRVILESPARVDHARHTETVQLAHEITRRQELMLPRELRPPGERRVEDGRIRPGDQQARRVARLVTLDVTPGRLWRVLRVPDGPQGRTVQQRPVVEVQHEHRRVRRRLVQLRQRRQPPLRELPLREAADHANPLGRHGTARLVAQHAHRLGE